MENNSAGEKEKLRKEDKIFFKNYVYTHSFFLLIGTVTLHPFTKIKELKSFIKSDINFIKQFRTTE